MCNGSVWFPHSDDPLRLQDFIHLKSYGIHGEAKTPPDQAHMAIKLTHPQWGQAMMFARKKQSAPSRKMVDADASLLPWERNDIYKATRIVTVRMEVSNQHVLRDRKNLLRYLFTLMGTQGVVALDHTSNRFWSREALVDEISHDAELDVQSLFSLHAITQDSQQEVMWLHTHGLAEIGRFDFDVVHPSRELFSTGADYLRAIAFMILEGRADTKANRCTLAYPDGDIRFVEAAAFDKHADDYYAGLRKDPDGTHQENRMVICDPSDNALERFRNARPSLLLSGSIDLEKVLNFSDQASQLMASRARGTYDVLYRLIDEMAEFQLPAAVKMGFTVDDGDDEDKEHLWFDVNVLSDDAIDATLISQPYQIKRMIPGQRNRHSIEHLSDWMIMTPFGAITPRALSVARDIRHNRDEFAEALKAMAND